MVIGTMLFGKQDKADHTKEIIGNWTLNDGWFPKQDLKFKKNRRDDDYMTFKFNPDGVIEYLHKSQGNCPVGEFTLKDGNWKIEDSKLTIQIRGLKISDYWYWYIIKYNIRKIDNQVLELKVAEIIKEREISPTLSWTDLIKEN